MEITENRRNDIVIVSIHGRLDASNAGLLEQKLLDLIARGDTRVVLDGAELDYISSAGLRVLLVAKKRLPAGGAITLCALKDLIKEIFDIAGFSSIFTIYETADEAIAAPREGGKAKEER